MTKNIQRIEAGRILTILVNIHGLKHVGQKHLAGNAICTILNLLLRQHTLLQRVNHMLFSEFLCGEHLSRVCSILAAFIPLSLNCLTSQHQLSIKTTLIIGHLIPTIGDFEHKNLKILVIRNLTHVSLKSVDVRCIKIDRYFILGVPLGSGCLQNLCVGSSGANRQPNHKLG